MVQIPRLQENQRLQKASVSPFQDASQAGNLGREIANFGETLGRSAGSFFPEKKEDKTAQRLYLERVKNEARAEAARIQSTFNTVGDELDGRTFQDEYEKNMGKRKDSVLKTVPEDVRFYADEVWEATRALESAKVYDQQSKQKLKNNNYLMTTALGSYVNNTRAKPNEFNVNFDEGTALIDDLIETGEMSPEFRENNIRSLKRQLSDAQIEGLVSDPEAPDNGSFNRAFQLLQERRDLYSPEEFEKKQNELTTQKYTVIDRNFKFDERAKKQREEELQRKTEQKIAGIQSEILRWQGDPVKLNYFRQQLSDELKKDSNYALPQTFQALKLSTDLQDQAMSFEISNELGTNPTQEKASKMFSKINYLLADGQLTPTKAQYWQNYVRNIMDRTKSDPRFSEKKKAGYTKLQAWFNITDFQKAIDFEGRHRTDYLFAVAKYEEMMGKGYDPEMALDVVTSRFNIMQQDRNSPKNYPEGFTFRPLNSREDVESERRTLNQAFNEGRMSKDLYRQQMLRVKKQEDILNARERASIEAVKDLTAPVITPKSPTPLMLQGPR